jgi:hypothetical protein
VADAAAKILTQLTSKDLGVSPRRIKIWLRVAAAKALLEGGAKATLEPQHLGVGENILWITPESRQVVAGVVAGISDPVRKEIMQAQADYETLRNRSKKIATYQEQAQVLSGVNRLLVSVEKLQSGEADTIRENLTRLKQEILEIKIETPE